MSARSISKCNGCYYISNQFAVKKRMQSHKFSHSKFLLQYESKYASKKDRNFGSRGL